MPEQSASAQQAGDETRSHDADQGNTCDYHRRIGTDEVSGAGKHWLVAHVRLESLKLSFLFSG